LPEHRVDSIQISVTSDGRLLVAGIQNKRLKLWDLTAKKDHELGPTSKEFPPVKFSRDGRVLALSDSYTVKLWDVTTMRELPALKVPNSGAFPKADAYISFT
jgi:WD40 repeat protein